jgi:dTDP-3-amino-3,4,6-trideoxy-alpha-D-glucose transaminase
VAIAQEALTALRVPFADPGRDAHDDMRALTACFQRVVESGRFILDEEVRGFEAEFAAACGQGQVVAVASGTDALELALRSLDIGPGDEVVTQANTCVPTIAAIVRTGATPVLCDADETASMSVASAASAVSPATRALLPVHLYGHCAELEALGALAAEHGLPVVEDCAHAVGATLHGRAAGTFGTLAAFSFYPTKQLGALGDAGAVSTSDPALAERLRELRAYGVEQTGINSRMDEIQAAFLRTRLPRLAAQARRREVLARRYDEAFADTAVTPLPRHPNRRHALHLYVVQVENRDAFRQCLLEAGIATAVHYAPSLDASPLWRDAVRTPVPLPRCHELARRVVSIPLFAGMLDAEQDAVIDAVRRAA